MSSLIRSIRSGVKSGASVPAVVIDVFYGKATVRLSSNGAILHNLEVIGGPVTVGQAVKVDFTTPEPKVVAISQEGVSLAEIQELIDANKEPGSTGGFDWEILLFADGYLGGIYPATDSGLTEAIASAGVGVNIYIPAGEIVGNYTIPNGATLSGMGYEKTIITGDITLGSGSSLENIYVKGSVIGPEEDFAVIRHSRIYNSGGIALNGGGGRLIVHKSLIQGGTYAATTTGQIYMYHSGVWGPTDWFAGAGSVFTFSVTSVPPDDFSMIEVKNQIQFMRSDDNMLWNGYLLLGDYTAPAGPTGYTLIDSGTVHAPFIDGNYLYYMKYFSSPYMYKLCRYNLTTTTIDYLTDGDNDDNPEGIHYFPLEDGRFVYMRGNYADEDELNWYYYFAIAEPGQSDVLLDDVKIYWYADWWPGWWDMWATYRYFWHIAICHGKIVLGTWFEFDPEDYYGEAQEYTLGRFYEFWIIDIETGALEKYYKHPDPQPSDQYMQYNVSPDLIIGNTVYITYHFAAYDNNSEYVEDEAMIWRVNVDTLTITLERPVYQSTNIELFDGTINPADGHIVWLVSAYYSANYWIGVMDYDPDTSEYSFSNWQDDNVDACPRNILRSSTNLYIVTKAGGIYLLGSYGSPVQSLTSVEEYMWWDEINAQQICNVIDDDGNVWYMESGTLSAYPIAGGSKTSYPLSFPMPSYGSYHHQFVYFIDGKFAIVNKDETNTVDKLYLLE